MRRKGFTLIELLVVIAIIGILAALIIVSLTGARAKATDTQLKNNARNLDTALAQYYQDQSSVYVSAATAGGTEVSSALSTGLSPYLSGGSSSAVFGHTGTDAKYISGTYNAVAGGEYAQAWTLKNGSETAVASGNGIYCTGGQAPAAGACGADVTVGTVIVPAPGGNINITGMRTAYTGSRAFVTYGPQ
ncbi:MAG TPA: type II secretion system protein [Candidatus Saccharimonadales bacterium]|nr:type II secretion system protein [Candidatus Saccharimonadales bacterium]